MCSQGYNHLPARGDAGTNPSHQRCCAASASHSGETQGDASPPHIHTTPAPTRVERSVRTSVSNLEETSMYHNITGKQECLGRDRHLEILPVTLSPFASLRGNSANGLARPTQRSFAALRACPERSEGMTARTPLTSAHGKPSLQMSTN